MKRATLLASILLATAPLYADVIRLSEPVQTDATSETFGAPMPDGLVLTNLTDVLNDAQKYSQNSFGMTATVKKVCQKKGCFLVAVQGPDSIRIAFKDYEFFVPTDIANRTITLVGKLVEQEVSEEQAKHFSKDLGEKGSIESGKTYEIVASSVRIPKS